MDLITCRAEIDAIDKNLSELLEKRMLIVTDVAAYKQEHGLEVHDPARENVVLEKVAMTLEHQELVPYVQRIFKAVMEESKKYEHKRIAGE